MTDKASSRAPYMTGIAGGSGSGKTYFLNQIRKAFSEDEVCIISQDDYYHPASQLTRDEDGELNYDLPGAIDDLRLVDDLQRLQSGMSFSIPKYTFNNPDAIPETILLKPAPVIVIEGLFLLHYPTLKQMLNLKIYMDSRDDIKLYRRLFRDQHERGLSEEAILRQWHYHVYPAYKKYLLPYKDEADLIITNNYQCENALNVLLNHLRMVVGSE